MRRVIIIIAILSLTVFAYGKDTGGIKAGTSKVHNNNNYWLTVWDDFSDGDPGGNGDSGEYPGGSGIDNLYSSGIWVGILHNSGYKVSTSNGYDEAEYVPELGFYTTNNWPSGWPLYGNFDTYVTCNDGNATEQGPIPVTAARHTWSYSAPVLDDFVGFKYIVRNDSSNTFSNVYVTHYADFDVGGPSSYDDDKVGRRSARDLAYMYDDTNGYFGIVCGTGDWASVGFSYWDVNNDPGSDIEKYNVQTNAGWPATTTPGDYRIGYTFKFNGSDFGPGETIVAGFYQVGGATWGEFSANVTMAANSYVDDDRGLLGIRSASLGEIKAIFK
ncbi:MAG: hypothetical protein GY771_01990 [bacterium]|nr:hypothetical protein [bacterium]